jgi:CBS domain-containing protein
MQKTVSEIMIRNVITAEPSAPVSYITRIMAEKNIGSVMIVQGEAIAGIVTERDIIQKVVNKALDPTKVKVSEIMSSNIISIQPDALVSKASQLMDAHRIKKLPVIDGGRLVGIVSEADVATALREELLTVEPVIEDLVGGGKCDFTLNPGCIYLVKEDKMSKSLDIFRDVVMQGVPGLCITRRAPEKIKDSHNLEKTPIIWLTTAKTEHKSISPQSFTELSLLISKFLSDTERAIILLDGLEYLIAQNNYNQVLRLIQALRDRVSTSNGHLLIPVCESALEMRELKLLEQEADHVIKDLNDLSKKIDEIESNSQRAR